MSRWICGFDSRHGPLPLTESGSSCHALSFGITATCIDIPRCIPLRLMNYKDALNASINDKLTKAKLIDIANTLQDRCLLNELDKQTLISPQSYIKDVQSRWDIHLNETRLLVKDIVNLGRNTRKVLVTAMNNMG